MMQLGQPRTVLVVQRRLTHYRIPLFEVLRNELANRDINLILAYGDPTEVEITKRDGGELPWAKRLHTRYLFGGRVCWQPFMPFARTSDLVILAHENKLVCNLWAQYRLHNIRVALWGHGANLQGSHKNWRERFKLHTSAQADWWFGYTEMSRSLIVRDGFPSDRVTILENAIDTRALRREMEAVSRDALSAWCHQWGLAGTKVGIYMGSLYAEKRIDFLLDSALRIRERVPEFELVIAGAGPESHKVKSFCVTNPWARYVGPVFGIEKAMVLSLGDFLLNPGGVGLGILDSFVCKVPTITTDCHLHGPEISYLVDGVNGIMTKNSMTEYVDAVVNLYDDERSRTQLISGCISSADDYTIENMARNFSDGIEKCLAMPSQRKLI